MQKSAEVIVVSEFEVRDEGPNTKQRKFTVMNETKTPKAEKDLSPQLAPYMVSSMPRQEELVEFLRKQKDNHM